MDAEAHELIAGYALDALDEADRARAKELLETSEEAREELRAFTEVAAALATAATGPAPRPELRDRIVDAARAEGQNVVPLDVKRRSRVVPVLAVGAAVAACAAIAAGVWGLSVSSDLDDARLALEQKRAAAAVLSDPTARTVALDAGDGRLVVDDEGSAVLVLDALDAAPAGKTYEVWIVDGDTPVRAGLFDGTDERDLVAVDGSVGPGSVIAVTLEKRGGVDAPTTTPVVASQPV